LKGKQDYYSILGVEKNVTDAGLKKAYRKLSKQYHPDVNPDASAAVKMQEINEAYNTLSDPQKKAEYDAGGGGNSGGGSGGRPAGRGHTQTTKDIFDDLFSGMKGVKMDGDPFGFGAGFAKSTKSANEKSANDKNDKNEKNEPDSDGNICKRCKGRGREQVFVSSGFGRMKKVQECPECGGTGKAKEQST